MKKQIILLNGPSSSGKSTLAVALQGLIEEKRGERYAVVSIDDFLHMTTRDAVYEDDVFEISPALCARAAAALENAPGVILEHVITSERVVRQCMELLPNAVRTVRVTCPPAELRRRERTRGDRCPGSAAASDAYLYPGEGYELTVDTHAVTVTQCAEAIYEALFPGEGSAIEIEEIPVERIGAFWDAHIRYLVDDGIISDEEDFDYFRGREYRGILEDHMRRETDRHHMVYFRRDAERIGAASYCTYQSEDGKCFVLDFWVFPEFRGNGTGHRCFAALERYTKADGAEYYELNSTKEASVRFWKSLGFTDNGRDEYDMPLLIRREDRAQR